MDHEKVAVVIKNILENDEKLSQAKMAKKCGVSRATVSKWLSGKLKISDKYIPLIESYLQKGNLKSIVNQSIETNNKESKYEKIQKDITDQLEIRNKYGAHYDFLVEHVIYLFRTVDNLQDDIKKNGLRVSMTSGNGHMREVDNASLKNLNTVSSQIMRVLKELGITGYDSEVAESIDLDAL